MVNAERFVRDAVEEILRESGKARVVIALSGGVDSSVCAALAAKAIGDRLIPIYVDTGLMRKGETERIEQMFGYLKPDTSGPVMNSWQPWLVSATLKRNGR